MMESLSEEELQKTLETVEASLMPGEWLGVLAQLRAGRKLGTIVDAHSRGFVLGMVNSLMKAVGSPVFQDRLEATPIEVIRADVVNACAVDIGNGPKIVIFTGLLKALVFATEFASLVTKIHAVKDRLLDEAGLEQGDIERMGYRAFCLVGHYTLFGAPLIRPYPAISRLDRSSTWISLSQSIWFVVAHELAHIELGHLTWGQEATRAETPAAALAIDEDIDSRKQLEFDADRFVLSTLNESEGPRAWSYALTPLTLFSSLEAVFAGERRHPHCTNRLQRIALDAAKRDDHVLSDYIIGVLDAQRLSHNTHVTARGNPWLFTSYEKCVEALLTLRDLGRLSERLQGKSPESPDRDWSGYWDLFVGHAFDD